MGKKVLRTLRMEGIDDVIEQKLENNKRETYGRDIIGYSIASVFPTSSHLSNLDSGRCISTSQIVPTIFSRPNFHASSILIHGTPAALFASLVVAQLGQAQYRVGCGSALEATHTEGLRTNGISEIVLSVFDDAGQVGTTDQSQILPNLESSNEGQRRTLPPSQSGSCRPLLDIPQPIRLQPRTMRSLPN
ncbi:hypothetical protein BLNAU_4043 [Blattamonas nauphoetae]|uniref:Uncharacterized protein n=1 Tax=Blattamonas nauphoetae TaxID=2049346 RepID=A0ABQ9YB07_9EUKA|nr:hypothetical protein BLNAU_4043 [Blattamonas nauphoetae]